MELAECLSPAVGGAVGYGIYAHTGKQLIGELLWMHVSNTIGHQIPVDIPTFRD